MAGLSVSRLCNMSLLALEHDYKFLLIGLMAWITLAHLIAHVTRILTVAMHYLSLREYLLNNE